VTRAAEECISLLARFVAPDRCNKVLRPLIESEDFPVNLAAIKMLTQVVESCSRDDVLSLLPGTVPGLLKVFTHYYLTTHYLYIICYSLKSTTTSTSLND